MIQNLMTKRLGVVASRFSWAAIAQVGKIVIQFGGIAIMTRLLPVSDFGLLAMAALFTVFATMLQDMGTSAAVIQRKELTQELINTVFCFNVLVGLGICLVLIVLSPLAARAFAEPGLQNVLIALATIFPLSSIGTVPMSLLQREGRLRRVGEIELISAIAGLALGVLAALRGFGVFSIVIQYAASGLLQTGMLWLSLELRPKLRWSRVEMKRTWSFSSHLVAFNTINYFARNTDKFLMARFLGATDLAIYSMAYRFITAPLQLLGGVFNRVLLPIYSEKQDRPAEIGSHFVKTLSLISLVSGPATGLLWGLRQPVVGVLLGPDWSQAADVLNWFAPVAYLQTLASPIGLVLMALGRTKLLRNIGFVNTVIFIAAFFAGIPFGIIGVAAAYFLANVVLCTSTLHVTLKLVDQSLWSLFRAIWKHTLFSAGIALAVWLPIKIGWLNGVSPLLALLLAPLGMALYLALLAVFSRDLLRSLLGAMNR